MASTIRSASVSEQIRQALLQAAAESYEDAGIRVRNTRRRIWRARLLVRRARLALENREPGCDEGAGGQDAS